jgi:hypothetical protein
MATGANSMSLVTSKNGFDLPTNVQSGAQVAHGNKHVVHVLPLGPDCGGGRMKLGSYPKYYTADSAGLCRLGTQGERWIFGKCCQERDMTAQSVDDLADN